MTDFSWRTHQNGYAVVNSRDGSSRVLIPKDNQQPPQLETYLVSEHPTLYAIFAKTALTEAGIIAFANRYGWLGVEDLGCAESSQLADLYGDGSCVIGAYGELCESWYAEIRIMRHALKLWRAAETENKKLLRQMIYWDADDNVVRYTDNIETDNRLVERFVNSGPLVSQLNENDIPLSMRAPRLPALSGEIVEYGIQRYNIIIPAKLIAGRIINRYLQAYSSPRLDWQRKEQVFILNSKKPTSLIGCMWYQFAEYALGLGKRRLVPCHACGKDFYALRSSAMYCGDTCKTQAYRMRKQGKSIVIPPG